MALREPLPSAVLPYGHPAEETDSAAGWREFHRVALALASEGDVNRFFELIATKCREVTTADVATLFLVEVTPAAPGRSATGEAAVLRCVAARTDSTRVDHDRVTLPLTRENLAGYVALTRTALNLPDVDQLPTNLEFTFDPARDEALGSRTVSA
ncbi:MAG: hypothetical protein ACRELA_09840, partial [Candidatus Rokuibacteriota bacterium]